MYNNIGSKIKGLAIGTCIVEVVAAVFGGIALMTNENVLAGWITFIFGPIFAWISSFVLYGFGQLIENSDKLVKEFVPEKENNTMQINNQQVRTVETPLSTEWKETIRQLTNDELRERLQSDDWEDEYKILCQQELGRRKL